MRVKKFINGCLCALGVLSVGCAGLAVGFAIWFHKHYPTDSDLSEKENVFLWATISGPINKDDTNAYRIITVHGPNNESLMHLDIPSATSDYEFKSEQWVVADKTATIKIWAKSTATEGSKPLRIQMHDNTQVFCMVEVYVLSDSGGSTGTPAITAIINRPIQAKNTTVKATITVTGWHGIDLDTLTIPTGYPNLEFDSTWNGTGNRRTLSVASSTMMEYDTTVVLITLSTSNRETCPLYIAVLPSSSGLYIDENVMSMGMGSSRNVWTLGDTLDVYGRTNIAGLKDSTGALVVDITDIKSLVFESTYFSYFNTYATASTGWAYLHAQIEFDRGTSLMTTMTPSEFEPDHSFQLTFSVDPISTNIVGPYTIDPTAYFLMEKIKDQHGSEVPYMTVTVNTLDDDEFSNVPFYKVNSYIRM